MKKTGVRLMLIICSLFFVLIANAETPKDFFVGKWKVVVSLLDGDVTQIVTFERKEGKLVGEIQEEGKPGTAFTKIEEEEGEVTAYFVGGGYDVYLYLEKIDENKIEGSMLDMFDCIGERVEEEKESKE